MPDNRCSDVFKSFSCIRIVFIVCIFRFHISGDGGNDLIAWDFSFALLVDENILQTPSPKESFFEEVTKNMDVDP